MPRISVVVPIFNVERYVTDCLESLAQQTERDLDVIMVDDGSTDSSAMIAQAFAEGDNRFRLIHQPNGGLGHARNTGADRATGQYLAFVDSDDVVSWNAYQLLSDSLDKTGSDFATGNFDRLTTTGTRQAGMASTAFNATRLKTHVSKHPALLYDRTAWNKLWRRTFWIEHGFRWPEGVLYEDIPVTIPAHVLARSVDVIKQPIYLWRARIGDSTSITQRRTEPRAIQDRCHAVDTVSRFLADQRRWDLKKRYDQTCAEQDLRYFLQQLDIADDAFRMLFLDLVNDFFDRADAGVFDHLPAIDRLKWHLVRRWLMPELLEVLRFEKSGEIEWTPAVRRGRDFYGDYPFREDTHLAVPEGVYRLKRDELPLRACINDVWWDGDTLRLRGYAHIAFLDLTKQGSARIRLTLEESGHPESVVLLDVEAVRRPDVTESAPDGFICYDWSGFDAALPVGSLRHRGGFRDGHWRLRVEVRTAGITRRRWLVETDRGRAQRPPLLTVDEARVIPTSAGGNFAVEISTRHARVDSIRVDDTVLELYGTLHGAALDPTDATIRVAREDGSSTLQFPVAAGARRVPPAVLFLTRIALQDLDGSSNVGGSLSRAADRGAGIVWQLSVLPGGSGGRVPLVAATGLDEPRLSIGDAEVVLRSTRAGGLQLIQRSFRPEVDRARWALDGSLELRGSYHEPAGEETELVLREAERAVEYTAAMTRTGDRFHAWLRPCAMPTLAGQLPLPAGQWDLYARSVGDHDRMVRVTLNRSILPELPSTHLDGARELAVIDVDYDRVAIVAGSDLPPSQTGRAGRERLQTLDYPAFLRLPRREQVLFDGYGPGRYGDDARALHEELVSRDTGWDVVWSMKDGQAAVPQGVRSVARHSREWYEALARSRFVVAADYRSVHDLDSPSEQTVLQTWHGTPITAVGLDDARAITRLGRAWESRVRREASQWHYLLSAGPASTATLARAFDYDGEVIESGLPRNDRLMAPNRDETTGAIRRSLGIAEDRTVVLYAPTYRPDQMVTPDRYRLDLRLDLDEAREALGDDYVLLLRAHPKVVDEVPAADGDFAVDVSQYADAGDLLQVADVLVTDYSSLMVDFATTGRPMIFFTYDLDYYRNHLRDLYIDPGRLPGPSVTTTAEMLAAVAEAAGTRRRFDAAYRVFQHEYCVSMDGRAAARVLDVLLGES